MRLLTDWLRILLWRNMRNKLRPEAGRSHKLSTIPRKKRDRARLVIAVPACRRITATVPQRGLRIPEPAVEVHSNHSTVRVDAIRVSHVQLGAGPDRRWPIGT